MSSGKLFRTEHLEQDLKNKALRGGSFTAGAQVVKFLLHLVSTIVLARLLLPEDYGLLGMTVVVSGFVGIVRDGGLNLATVQRETITHEETSLLFWINVLIGFVIAIVLICISPLVASAFGETRLRTLLCALAIPFLIGGFTVQHKALLQRQMKFGRIAIIEIGSMLVGIVVAITFAKANFGYWALAFKEIATSVSVLILVWAMMRWKPAAPKWSRDIVSTLRFGGNLVLFNVVNYISKNADNALIGWYWGAASLGLYSRAYSLLMLPIRNLNAPFVAVSVPVLSRVSKAPERLKRYFIEAASIVTAAVIPLVTCTAIFADDIVRILLGESWLAAADLFRLLSVPALLFGASQPISWLFIVLDRTHLLRNIGLVAAPINILAFLIGLPYGPEGVAIGYSICSSLLFLPMVMYALNGTGITMVDVFGTWVQPLVGSIAGIAIGLLVKFVVLPQQPQMVNAVAAIACFGMAYFGMMVFVFDWKNRAIAWFGRKSDLRQIQACTD